MSNWGGGLCGLLVAILPELCVFLLFFLFLVVDARQSKNEKMVLYNNNFDNSFVSLYCRGENCPKA